GRRADGESRGPGHRISNVARRRERENGRQAPRGRRQACAQAGKQVMSLHRARPSVSAAGLALLSALLVAACGEEVVRGKAPEPKSSAAPASSLAVGAGDAGPPKFD